MSSVLHFAVFIGTNGLFTRVRLLLISCHNNKLFCLQELGYIVVVIVTNPMFILASSPGSLLIIGGRREPGNIRRKSCRLLAPCSGGTNQIAERNHVYT